MLIPVDHGSGHGISGLASDGAGLIAVRPGTAGDALVYFSPNGQTWQYAATIGAAGGLRPSVVKGSDNGFVVTGTNAAGDNLAYTAAGDGLTWLPTAPLGSAASQLISGATVGAAGTVIAAGNTTGSQTSQQAVLLRATTGGTVQPVPLAAIPGAVVPELTLTSLAVDRTSGQRVAVGSADGYPAIWRQTPGRPWTLVSTPALFSADPGLAALTSVTHDSDSWLAAGLPGPILLTSADGLTWQPVTGPVVVGLRGVIGAAAAAGPLGYAIVGKLVAPSGACVADVWWSPDSTTWTQAHDVNDTNGSSQVTSVAATGRGFISAGSHDGQPAVWATSNGPAWTTTVLPLPAGGTGVLQQIAVTGQRIVALGQQVTTAGTTLPLAELSTDGGASWRQIPLGAPGSDTTVTALTAARPGSPPPSRPAPPARRRSPSGPRPTA